MRGIVNHGEKVWVECAAYDREKTSSNMDKEIKVMKKKQKQLDFCYGLLRIQLGLNQLNCNDLDDRKPSQT